MSSVSHKGPIPSTMPNMILSLSLICALVAALLGLVYIATKPLIDANAQKAEQEAIAQVLPAFDNHPAAADTRVIWDKDPAVVVFPATQAGQAVGWAVKSYSDRGYAKRITLMVGILPDGSIRTIQVMEQSETPGLGTKMTEARFKNQFDGKNPTSFKLQVTKDGGDVDAITAATISSRAFCDAVNRAFTALAEVKK